MTTPESGANGSSVTRWLAPAAAAGAALALLLQVAGVEGPWAGAALVLVLVALGSVLLSGLLYVGLLHIQRRREAALAHAHMAAIVQRGNAQ